MAGLWQSAGALVAPAGAPPEVVRRASLGLGQFFPIVTDTPHASVLDLGCVWQATVAAFTGAGCKLYTEDLFEALHRGLRQPPAKSALPAPPLAERFLAPVLRYPPGSFRGILLWDLFDYLPEELVLPLRDRLDALLIPGGALLALFHNRPPQETSFSRCRVADAETLELVPAPLPLQRQRVFQNRAMVSLFASYRTARTFVGRDTLRELLVVK